jgi:hypothetical protein
MAVLWMKKTVWQRYEIKNSDIDAVKKLIVDDEIRASAIICEFYNVAEREEFDQWEDVHLKDNNGEPTAEIRDECTEESIWNNKDDDHAQK